MGLENGLPTSRKRGLHAGSVAQCGDGGRAQARRKLHDNDRGGAVHEVPLMWVEFATRDVQTVMRGCSTLPYNAAHKATVSEAGTNRIVIAADNASNFCDGTRDCNRDVGRGNEHRKQPDGYGIGDVRQRKYRHLLRRRAGGHSGGKRGVFGSVEDGLVRRGFATSGSPMSNTSGKYTCVLPGRETPYGGRI